MNTIARCAYGIETDAHKNPDQELIKCGHAIAETDRTTDWPTTLFFHLFSYFPWVENKIPIFPPAYDKAWDITKSIMKQR